MTNNTEDLELLKKYDSDEDLLAKSEFKRVESRLWGNLVEQAHWKKCVLETSNIFNGSILILFRVILFTYSVWIVAADYERTNGLNYQKYTIWGEVSTCVALFLLLTTSSLKFAKDVLRIESELDKAENHLYKWTAFFY